MSDAMRNELSPHLRPETSTANIEASGDIVVSNAINKLPKDKGKQVKKNVSKWRMALAGVAIPFIAACGWGNSEQSNFPPIPEPTPVSTLIPNLQTATQEQISSVHSPIETIRKMEAEIGDKPLTFDQASEHKLNVIELVIKTYPFQKSSSQINNNTFFYRHDCELVKKEDNPSETPTVVPSDVKYGGNCAIKQLLEDDYPNSGITSDEALGVSMSVHMFQGFRGGINRNERIFLILARINDPDIDAHPPQKKIPLMQFKKSYENVECMASTPIVRLRSTLAHEATHLLNESLKESLIDQSLLASVINTLENDGFNKENLTVEQHGIIITYEYKDRKSTTYTRTLLHELITDYLATKVSTSNDLPYTTLYGGPHDFKNFENVLQQAEIDTDELIKYYKKGDLKELLLRISSGAKNIQFANEEEKLGFIVQPLLFSKDEKSIIDWGRLQPYFPKVDTNKYEYTLPDGQHSNQQLPQNPQGCLSMVRD